MRSLVFLAGTAGCVTSTYWFETTSPIGAKSFSGSNGSFAYRLGAMVR
jgi:hypothetical protein